MYSVTNNKARLIDQSTLFEFKGPGWLLFKYVGYHQNVSVTIIISPSSAKLQLQLAVWVSHVHDLASLPYDYASG